MATRTQIVRFTQLALGCFVIVAGAACSDDVCTRGATECLSGTLLRTCVPGEDGPQWIVSQCAAGESCGMSAAADSAGDDDAGVSPRSAPACMPRAAGSGVRMCTPAAKACASERVAKVCDADGTGWVETDCPSNQSCIDAACRPDPDSPCDKDNSCIDELTAVHCADSGRGYVLERCPGETYCEAGRCRGPVCVTGTSCGKDNQVRECVDGTSYRDTPCGTGEVCEQRPASASCVPVACKLGDTACGDPRDGNVSKTQFFTTCVAAMDTGTPQWVRGECTGQATCSAELAAMRGNPCSQECTPGAQRCGSDAISGVSEGVQTCLDDATWGPSQSCNEGSATLRSCAVVQDAVSSNLPKAVCAQPVCKWIFDNPRAAASGTCDGEQLRLCQPDGTLADAQPCTSGSCRSVGNVVTADGRIAGACTTQAECQPGEQQCVADRDEATPRFRSCNQGLWASELETCADDAPCRQAQDERGLRRILCGADCSPGERRCNDAGQLETCSAAGRFDAGVGCDIGVCRELAPRDAACVLECMPGSVACEGSTQVASDGYHFGKLQQVVCDAAGRKQPAESCPSGTVCRSARSGAALGCVACVGGSAPGGNEGGTTDSRCDPNDSRKLQECSDDDTWSSSRACSGTKQCVAPKQAICGSCLAASGATLTCSQALLASDRAGTSCESLGYGAPGNWAGLSDCCAEYQNGSTYSFAYCQ